MDNWISYLIIAIALLIIIGNLSTFQKSKNHKMRKKNLNDLQETLPRSKRAEHQMPTIEKDHSK